MSNQYPIWKYLLIACVLLIGFVYASPNLYMPDPAIQVSGESSSLKMDERVLKKIKSALSKQNIVIIGEEIQDGKSILIRFNNDDDQLKAQGVLNDALGDAYITALNRASNTPDWLKSIGAGPLKLGLDLSGGVHFLLEVDVEEAVNKNLESCVSKIKTELKDKKNSGLFKLKQKKNKRKIK
ncbi:MAG: hypothetical protein AAGF06_06500 [Pseudomonadota bacterium]